MIEDVHIGMTMHTRSGWVSIESTTVLTDY